VYALAFQPLDLLPAALDDFFDDILVGGAIPPLPGIEHMVERMVQLVLRIDGGHPSLGRTGVGFLRVRHLGHREDRKVGPPLVEERRTPKSGTARPDDQDIACRRGLDLQLFPHGNSSLQSLPTAGQGFGIPLRLIRTK